MQGFWCWTKSSPVAEIVRLLSLGIHGFVAYPQVTGHLLEAVAEFGTRQAVDLVQRIGSLRPTLRRTTQGCQFE